MLESPLHHDVPVDPGSASDLRDALVATRQRLSDVLAARTRTLSADVDWIGPARRRFEQDTADLLDAGRVLDRVLADLLVAVEVELEATR